MRDFRKSDNSSMFVFANIRDFRKLFTVKHKHVCVCVLQTSQTASGAVSAAANINRYGCMHMHTAFHVHNWCVCAGICA